jgi:hypothetical protein
MLDSISSIKVQLLKKKNTTPWTLRRWNWLQHYSQNVTFTLFFLNVKQLNARLFWGGGEGEAKSKAKSNEGSHVF